MISWLMLRTTTMTTRWPAKSMAPLWRTSMFLALWALIGCGGGNSSTNSGPAPTQTASYLGTAAQQGQWYTLPYTMPTIPGFGAPLNTGRVTTVSGSGNDPSNAASINTNP